MDLGDHLVLTSLFCRFRKGRSKTLCVSSRVYLINCRVGHRPNFWFNLLSFRLADQEFQIHICGSKLKNIRDGRADRWQSGDPSRLSQWNLATFQSHPFYRWRKHCRSVWRPKPKTHEVCEPGSLGTRFLGLVLSRDVELLVRAGLPEFHIIRLWCWRGWRALGSVPVPASSTITGKRPCPGVREAHHRHTDTQPQPADRHVTLWTAFISPDSSLESS